MKRQFLLVILIGWAITSAAQSGQEYLESYDDASTYCSTIDVIVAAAPGNFRSIAKTKHKHKHTAFYKSIIQMPGFMSNYIFYDKVSSTFCPGGFTTFEGYEKGKAAFVRIKRNLDTCLGPSLARPANNTWLEGASWIYTGPKNGESKPFKLYFLLVLEMASSKTTPQKWNVTYSMLWLHD